MMTTGVLGEQARWERDIAAYASRASSTTAFDTLLRI